MDAAKCRIMGSDYIGVFATATDKNIFVGSNLPSGSKKILADSLKVRPIGFSVSGSDLIGLFCKANSSGIILSNIILDEEFEALKRMGLDANIDVLQSNLNAVGSNILANDRIAIVNPEYSHEDMKKIGEILDVEVIKSKINGFNTVGANNILTNKGLVINNRSTEEEKTEWDSITRFNSIRSTANVGSLYIGLAVVANSNAVVAGDSTTGFELARITEALE